MPSRTSTKTITFERPFVLGGLRDVHPAGDYSVETDEERVEGVSFIAYRRVSVVFHLPSPDGNPALTRTVVINPGALDAALLRDAAPPADELPG